MVAIKSSGGELNRRPRALNGRFVYDRSHVVIHRRIAPDVIWDGKTSIVHHIKHLAEVAVGDLTRAWHHAVI